MSEPVNNYNSPYGKAVRQYPSQSSEYISFEFGGCDQLQQSSGHQSERYTSTPAKRNNRLQQNFRIRRGQHRFHNDYNRQYSPMDNSQNYQQHSGRQSYHHSFYEKKERGDQDFYTTYFHPSMIEDPWKELMERHNAMNASKISRPESSPVIEDNQNSDHDEQNG